MKLALVGLGHQGLFHLDCLHKADESRRFNFSAVIDSRPQTKGEAFSRTKVFSNAVGLRHYTGLDAWLRSLRRTAGEWVLDICTPPSDHLPIFKKAAEHGVRKFIIEKPLADTAESAHQIAKIAIEKGCLVALQENYIFSPITGILKEKLKFLRPSLVTINFSKDRRLHFLKERGRTGAAHLHNYDIEMPHQVALALYLFGKEYVLENAAVTDLKFEGATFIDADHGFIQTAHPSPHGGTITVMLRSSFSQRDRERHVDIDGLGSDGKGYKLNGLYALGSGELLGGYRWRRADEGGAREHRDDILDDSLTASLKQAIIALHNGEQPEIGPDFGCRVIDLIESAKTRARPK